MCVFNFLHHVCSSKPPYKNSSFILLSNSKFFFCIFLQNIFAHKEKEKEKVYHHSNPRTCLLFFHFKRRRIPFIFYMFQLEMHETELIASSSCLFAYRACSLLFFVKLPRFSYRFLLFSMVIHVILLDIKSSTPYDVPSRCEF